MNLKLMKKLCSYKKKHLETILRKYLCSKGYKNIIQTDMYTVAEGDLPICLIAHMDTVFRCPPDKFYYDAKEQVLWSPGGAGFDDRAGIYAISNILEAGYRPSIIFTDQEERGGIGAKKLVEDYPDCIFNDCRALIQLDRANKEDCVYYDCDNEAFENFISKFGFQLDWGSFSDISIIAPVWGIAAVNLSIGYEDEHTGCERLHCDWCDLTIERVKKILDKSRTMKSYAYIPYIYTYKRHTNPYDVSGFGPIEEDIDTTWIGRCVLCGNRIVDPQTSHKVNDMNMITYSVCDNCYSQYYGDPAII